MAGASPRNLSISKKFNGDQSYRVGEVRRAHPKRLAHLPNIYPQNCTSKGRFWGAEKTYNMSLELIDTKQRFTYTLSYQQ